MGGYSAEFCTEYWEEILDTDFSTIWAAGPNLSLETIAFMMHAYREYDNCDILMRAYDDRFNYEQKLTNLDRICDDLHMSNQQKRGMYLALKQKMKVMKTACAAMADAEPESFRFGGCVEKQTRQRKNIAGDLC